MWFGYFFLSAFTIGEVHKKNCFLSHSLLLHSKGQVVPPGPFVQSKRRVTGALHEQGGMGKAAL